MVGSKSAFQQAALASGLISRADIEQAIADIGRQSSDIPAPLVEVSDDQLSRRLVESNMLTTYQVDQLMMGHSKLNLGPYTITHWVAQGGMGQVFRAVHQVMGREVAVKVLPISRTTPASIDNFHREIRTQAQLDHPNLVRAYDAGHDGNVHFLVTEYVPGLDLRRLIRTQGPLSMAQASTVVTQAALALDHAHRQGLIHRDVKPGNLLVTPEGLTKLSDLGLAGFVLDSDDQPNMKKVVGTADYLAPEVITTPHEVSTLSDIYSLGCTLYYAITGKVPFPGGSSQDKLRRHCSETPWHPRRFCPHISEEFVEVIAEMMEKDPSERIQSAEEVANRLEPWVDEAGPCVVLQMTKSPWALPPMPNDPAAESGLQDMDAVEEDFDFSDDPISGRFSQATDSVASSREETDMLPSIRPRRAAPSLPQPPPDHSPPFRPVLFALAISIPISMLAGALLAAILMRLL